MKKISLVIPCCNEEEVLPKLFNRVNKSAKQWKMPWEAICIDDGSTDETLSVLKRQTRHDNHWKVVSFSRNFGHQTAISCGLNYAKGDAIVVLDADLQDPPEEIIKFINKWKQGNDVIYAVRKKRKENFLKQGSYWLFYRLFSKLTDFNIPLDSGDFSLMDRKVVKLINAMPERHRFVRGLRAWTGFKQVGLEFERASRAAGRSKYSTCKLVGLALDGILSFSTIPLLISVQLGLFISLLALFGIIFLFVQHIFQKQFIIWGLGPPTGFATTVISVLFLGGIQLIFLGIIGTYLSRIYEEIKTRPHWVIKDSYGFKNRIN